MLVHSAPVSIQRDLGGWHPNLGVLSSPRRVYLDAPEYGPWAADNDAFLAWDEDGFMRMLDAIRPLAGCLFVTAPDVVGDAATTEQRFWEWLPRMSGHPVAFVAQDGIEHTNVPWGEIAALFIGGSSEFKLGDVAHRHVVEAKRRGLWVHMGRVNTRQRFRWAKSIGCDSVDGTAFSRYRRTHLPWALEWAGAQKQMNLLAVPAARGEA